MPSVISDEGNSMSEGFNDIDRIKMLLDDGLIDERTAHMQKVKAYYDLAREMLSQYENLSEYVHLILPDTQGPFDLACLVWGSSIFTAFYDYPEMVHQLIGLMTDTFISYNTMMKERINEPLDSAYHIVGLKLVNGGVRICDDSATLVSPDIYQEFIRPYNIRAFEPFNGGWLHYCGDGNHIIDQMLSMPGVHALHLGNPDYHDFFDVYEKCVANDIVLYWSGSLDYMQEFKQKYRLKRIQLLAENRYAAKNVKDAKQRLSDMRNCRPIIKAAY